MEKFEPKKAGPEIIHPLEETINRIENELFTGSKKFSEEHPETAMWIHDQLRKIDLGGLHAAFKKIIESVQSSFDPERVPPLESIFIVDDPAVQAAHYPGMRFTKVNGSDFLPGKDAMSERSRVAQLLTLVCHEYAHSTGYIHWSDDGEKAQIGYEKRTGDKSEMSLFNEGMTEIVAERVAKEYLSSNPISTDDRENPVLDVGSFKDFLDTTRLLNDNYSIARDFAKLLFAHVATKRSVPMSSVENAFVEGYFKGAGEFFDNPGMLDPLIGDGFGVALRYSKSAQDLRNIEREYKMTTVTPEMEQEIEAALRELAKRQ